jgi:hypothetical protein
MSRTTGVILRRNAIAEVAGTLAEFCQHYAKVMLKFITKAELRRAPTIDSVVRLVAGSATPCDAILAHVPTK